MKKQKKSKEEVKEIQSIYDQMGARVEIDEYGDIKHVAYK